MNREPQPTVTGTTISLESIASQIGVNVDALHLNVSQEVIITTEDKVRLCLSKYLQRMSKKRGWISPLGIFIAITVTLSTASFKEKTFGLSADTWHAIFVIACITSLIWFICAAVGARQSVKVDDVVDELKKVTKKQSEEERR